MAAVSYVIYETGGPTPGRIVSSGVTDDSILPSLPGAGQAYLQGVTALSEYNYVLTGAVVDRPVLAWSVDKSDIVADGFDTSNISGVPTGWAYAISNGATGTTDGTVIAVTALEPGIFTLDFTNWPYQDVRYTINANPTPFE